MESSRKGSIPIPILVVLYDFRYMWKDNREIAVKKGEKLLLLEKTNRDWWQVVRPTERKSFFVPAQYVELLSKRRREDKDEGSDEEGSPGFPPGEDSVLYENLDNLKQQSIHFPGNLPRMCKGEVIGHRVDGGKPLGDVTGRSKPVPKTRTKVMGTRPTDEGENLSESESLRSYISRNDKTDKNDKVSPIDKMKPDSSLSPSMETVCGEGSGRSYRGGKGVRPVAVENLVYSKVPIVSDPGNGKIKHSNYVNKVNVDTAKNRMKNSYNLKTRVPGTNLGEPCDRPLGSDRNSTRQCSSVAVRTNEKLLFTRNFSKSLEKLAEEIKFEPRKMPAGSTVKSTATTEAQTRLKSTKPSRENPPDNKKLEKRSKTSDASVVLDENKIQPQSRSVFSRFRRSLHHSNSFKSNNLKKLAKTTKKACELSLSWEGGLDKIQEKKDNDEKPSVTPLGLQRSRTFMFPERSPLSVRPANKLFSGKHRLDTAYHSQRKPDEKVTLSTFKPAFSVDVTCDRPSRKDAEGDRERKDHHMDTPRQKKAPSEQAPQPTTASKTPAPAAATNTPRNSLTKPCKSAIVPEILSEYQVPDPGPEPLTLYSEPYCSNSESEDNLEEKSLAVIINKSLRSQSSIDSNLTVSEGTEASESDENSLEFALENPTHMVRQPANKKRTSLVRNSRVESSKVRKVPARLPLTPPPDVKPMRDLGDGWGQYVSKGGRCFYYNVKTREKNWKPPRRTTPVHDVAFIGSFESVYSDANRSNTSSPLNDNGIQGNSLTRSNGSLSSKTLNNNHSLETPKGVSVGSRWKEDSPDDLRSSYNSSPVAGLSQSSGYSLNKSSRDSLNRFSPIDNIPSEEEGFELHDHVLKKEVELSKRKAERTKGDDGGTSKEIPDDSAFRIKPGWEEFYDEGLDQIFYVHKDRKERWILSFDSEERAYFFEETSKKSLWALPDYSSESSKQDFLFPIQRSATESAITNEAGGPKLRQSKDGDKGGNRVSGSARSSKTQSMLIEPKFDISASNGSKAYSMPRDLSKIFGEIVHVGILNKTKILENGKKLRKNWTPSFVVLTDSFLFFFKDAKSFQNMKNVVSPSNNQMCLSLQGAVIEKGDKISSRKNVYKISCSDNTDVLIQTEKSSEAEDWFREISGVIQNLPQEPNTASSSPLLDISSPSKVGRTKSLKVRSKETGSMEDLSSTPEDRQNKIKAKLRKFFIRRPTVDSLKKKGIWKDEPVFGCSLEQITKNRNPRVPVFVEKCIEFIESKEENMKTDGLYRASGNLSQVQKIRLEVDQNNLNIMKDEEDVHVLTGSLKLFFRELKEPLIPSKQLEPALLATDKQVRKERIRDFQKIVKSLPTPNHDTLKFLLQHLLRVKEYHKYNRMNINNLAIVFGPTLMWPEQESANMALELMQQNVVIECLLKEFHEIFT